MTSEQVSEQVKITGVTATVYEVPPPSHWFWVVKIAAQDDVTKHDAIKRLSFYTVLTYADAIIAKNTPPEDDKPTADELQAMTERDATL